MKNKGWIALTLLLCALMLFTACTGGTLPEQPTDSENGPDTDQTTPPETDPAPEEEESIVPNDGKPKKFFTLSFDDGITQDLKVIEILKKYNVKCVSFNINTGLLGASWDWVGTAIGDPSITHQRFTEAEIESGIYDGYDVLVHTLKHAALKNYDEDASQIEKAVGEDADNIEELTGIRPVGMAWPGGDTDYTLRTIEHVLETTDIRFARGTTSTYNFNLPMYFMKWLPTCSVTSPRCLTLARQFIDAECTEDMLFYVWGHAYELDLNNGEGYEILEQLIKMMSEAEDVYLVTNTEFYNLYKDQIPSWMENE